MEDAIPRAMLICQFSSRAPFPDEVLVGAHAPRDAVHDDADLSA